MFNYQVGHIFQKHKNLFEERQSLLFPDKTDEKEDFHDIPCNNIISLGAVNILEKWPSHIYYTFLSGFFISITLLFTILAIVFCFPIEHYKNRETRNVEIQKSYNVYFIKHENRTWSRKELCYIETAAHKYPESKIYLINLADSQKNHSIHNEFIDMDNFSLFSNYLDVNNQNKNFTMSQNLSSEMFLRNKIAFYNSNVRNIDISAKELFKGSLLSSVYKKLTYEIMEIAAKASILWNYPGIALNPAMIKIIDNVEKYFCHRSKMSCQHDQNFIIELKGEVQASSVPCHVFLEFIMKEIIKNPLSNQHQQLQNILNDFCPRMNSCPGVTILEQTSNYSLNETFCPTIFSDGAKVE